MLEPIDCCLNTYSRISTADENGVNVKASMGFLYSIDAVNINIAIRYLKIYDKATAPTSSDTPKLRLGVPGGATGGIVRLTFPKPVRFLNGIGIRLVTGIADNDATAGSANETLINLAYD